MRLRQVFLWSMVASLGLDAVLGIAALLLPARGPVGELLGSAALFAGFSLLALLCAIVVEKRGLVPLMWAGIGCAATALVPWLVLIWLEGSMRWEAEEVLARLGGTFSVPPFVIAQCGLLSLLRLQERWGRSVRLGTYAVSALLGACILVLIWWWDPLERYIDDDLLWRGLGVMTILALCGTVTTPIVWKVQALRRAGGAESVPVNVEVRLACPRCGREQLLPAGRGACAGCGLRIAVEIEEPRCACGYLLHGLAGERCPECGEVPGAGRAPAPVAQRRSVPWAVAAGALPGLLLLAIAGAHWSLLGAWGQPPQPWSPTPVPPASFIQTGEVNNALLWYASQNRAYPSHVIELTAGPNELPPARFCAEGTQTTPRDVPLGDGTLEDFAAASRTDRLIAIGSLLRAAPAGLVAHRLGDFVFTYHGATANNGDAQLWTVLLLPDPDQNGPPAPGDPVWIGRFAYGVLETTIEELPGLLDEQNLHRAALKLPPLPDLTGLTHDRPVIASAP